MEAYKEIVEFVKQTIKDEKVSGFDHAKRVYDWCETIGRKEGADLEVLRIAALLHDVAVPKVGRPKHFEEGARMAEKFLAEKGFPEKKIRAVSHAIEAHSRFGGPTPATKEAKILYDADILDFIGAIGIVRGVGRKLTSGELTEVEQMPNIIKNMLKVEDKFYTPSGREFGRERFRFMEKFLEQLGKELVAER